MGVVAQASASRSTSSPSIATPMHGDSVIYVAAGPSLR